MYCFRRRSVSGEILIAPKVDSLCLFIYCPANRLATSPSGPKSVLLFLDLLKDVVYMSNSEDLTVHQHIKQLNRIKRGEKNVLM